jgi:hypothetical protein
MDLFGVVCMLCRWLCAAKCAYVCTTCFSFVCMLSDCLIALNPLWAWPALLTRALVCLFVFVRVCVCVCVFFFFFCF